MRRHLLRFGPTVVFLVVAIGSIWVLVLDHRRLEATLERVVATTDNLSQARLHVVRALLAVERLRMGDPTVAPDRPLAEFDEALSFVDDLVAGRSSVLEMSPQPWGPEAVALAERYAGLIREVRADAGRGALGSADVAYRTRVVEIEGTAQALERELYDGLGERLVRENQQHFLRVGAWIGFLLLAGAGLWTLRRARDRSEVARRSADLRYATLASHAAAQLVRVDAAGRVVESADGTLGPHPGDLEHLAGEPWWNVISDEEAERTAELWMARSRQRDMFSLEFRRRSGDDTRWFATRWALDRGSGEASWVGIFLDETENRRLEEQLRQLQRLESVGRLTSGIAHDFNNLLTVITSSVDLLESEPSVDGTARELVDEIGDAAQSGRDLVQRLMGYSRKSSLEMEPLDLAEVVPEAARLAQRLLPESVNLDVQTAGRSVVHADGRAVQQILMNLVSNARDAMTGGGRIRVETDTVDVDEAYREAHPWVEPGRYGRLTVSDTGTGMDKATLQKIFDPFFTTKAEGLGTGLGLATVQGLVRQHGGHIHAYSEPGQGTTFRVYLPLVTNSDESEARAPDGVQYERRPRKLRLLLVEDEDALRRVAHRLLTRLGHEVIEAPSGRQALRLLDGGLDVDVVISDVAMSDINGVELFEALRGRGLPLPFVFTSGYSLQEMIARVGMPAGPAYLSKPWSVADLERVLAEVA